MLRLKHLFKPFLTEILLKINLASCKNYILVFQKRGENKLNSQENFLISSKKIKRKMFAGSFRLARKLLMAWANQRNS